MNTRKADIEPNHGLIEESLQRVQSIQEIFKGEKWLTAEMLNQLQEEPPSNQSLPADDWKQQGRIFGVTFEGKENFPCYEFDTAYQPLPLVRDILVAFGPVLTHGRSLHGFTIPTGGLWNLGTRASRPWLLGTRWIATVIS